MSLTILRDKKPKRTAKWLNEGISSFLTSDVILSVGHLNAPKNDWSTYKSSRSKLYQTRWPLDLR